MQKVYDIIYILAFVVYIGACMCRCKFLPCFRQNIQNSTSEPEDEAVIEARRKYIEKRIIVKKATNIHDFSVCKSDSLTKDEEVGQSNQVSDDEDYKSTTNNSVVNEKLQNVGTSIQRLASSIREGLNNLLNTPSESEKTCPICICEFELGDEICYSRNPECPHMFHLSCMSEWLIKHDVCPLCRVDYLKVSDGTDESILNHHNNTQSLTSSHGSGAVIPSNGRSTTTVHVHLYA